MIITREVAPGIHITITLTPDEVEAAYREQERIYRLTDAEKHFLEVVGYDIDCDDDDADNLVSAQKFEDTYGFSISEAINFGADNYLMADILQKYEDSCDCNSPENDNWENAVRAVLRDHTPSTPANMGSNE